MTEFTPAPMTNGKGAAAIIAVGIASVVLGISTLAGDAIPRAAALFNIWNPTGPLSGVTVLTIVVWLSSWGAFAKIWAARDVNLRVINWIVALMVVAGLLLTFPPFMDFLQGR